MKIVKNFKNLLICILLMFFITDLYAANESKDSLIYLEKQVVTASRIPTALENTSRAITIITKEEILNSPAQAVSDLLEYVNGVDVRQRGPNGVQADIHMRGGTFEQTLILIDGIKMGDPQTSHHIMDLPLTLQDIERIEILPGSASRLYGPNAFGGVINIITRKGHEKSIKLTQTAGEYGFSNTDLSLSVPLAQSGNRISIQKRVSSGYETGTEFDITGASFASNLGLEKTNQNIFVGYLDKPFGAYKFYSTKYPDGKEHTKTFFLNSHGTFLFGNVTLYHKLYWRRHFDHFVLDRYNPSFSENTHTTHSYGGEIQADIPSAAGITALGIIAHEEAITSTNLGDHSRYYGGVVGEHQFTIAHIFHVTPGILSYYYKNWGWQFCPGIDMGLSLTKPLRVYSSIGRSFRTPSYTELYYDSPAVLGDPDLKPEESWSIDVGLKYTNAVFSGDICLFNKYGENIIDWFQDMNSGQRRVQSLDVTTDGVEAGVSFFPSNLHSKIPVSKISCTYSFLETNRDKLDTLYNSIYVINHLRNQFNADISYYIFNFADQLWRIKYEDRVNAKETCTIVDTRLNIKIWQAILFLEVSNIFDVEFEDVGGVPMPGRWVKGGLNISLTK